MYEVKGPGFSQANLYRGRSDMPTNFTEYRANDGSITKLSVVDGDVQVLVRNWREEMEIINFRDVIGLEAYSFSNTALSHATETASDPLLERSCSVGGEQAVEFRCYAFFSAWADLPVLKIVARSFSLEKVESGDPRE